MHRRRLHRNKARVAPSGSGAVGRLSRRLRGGRVAAAATPGHGAWRSDGRLEDSDRVQAGDCQLAAQASRAEAISPTQPNPGGLLWPRMRVTNGSISTATIRFIRSLILP